MVISVIAVLLYFAFPPQPQGDTQILAEIVRHASLLTPAYLLARMILALRRPKHVMLSGRELWPGDQKPAVDFDDIKEITVRKNLMTSGYGFTLVDKYFQFHTVDAYYLPEAAGAMPEVLKALAEQRAIRYRELQPSLFHTH